MEAGFPSGDPETTRRFAVRLNLQHRWGNQLQLLWVAPHIGQLAERGLPKHNPQLGSQVSHLQRLDLIWPSKSRRNSDSATANVG